jgi:hypothetical protein
MVFGLSPEFFEGLKKHHGKLPKQRKNLVSSPIESSSSPIENPSMLPSEDSSEESAEEDEVEVPVVVQPAPRGRGRGGRGSRGGRGRGSRGGRGRGGRARGGTARGNSSAPSKASRNAVPMVPLTEEDDGQPSNQSTPNSNAKPLRLYAVNPVPSSDEEAVEDYDSDDAFFDRAKDEQMSKSRQGSPPRTSAQTSEPPYPSTKASGKQPVPKIAVLPQSASQTPRDSASTPAESAVPKLLDPEDDVLSDSDLPDPFIYDAPSPIEAECEDRADYLLQTRFKPMIDVQEAIAALSKHPASQRSTETLYALTQNAQFILKAWQDEYLMLDARVSNCYMICFHLLTALDRTPHAPA